MPRHTGMLIGLAIGLVLGLAGAFGGFGAFLVVLVLGVVGAVIGRVLDGDVDLSDYLGGRRDRADR